MEGTLEYITNYEIDSGMYCVSEDGISVRCVSADDIEKIDPNSVAWFYDARSYMDLNLLVNIWCSIAVRYGDNAFMLYNINASNNNITFINPIGAKSCSNTFYICNLSELCNRNMGTKYKK